MVALLIYTFVQELRSLTKAFNLNISTDEEE